MTQPRKENPQKALSREWLYKALIDLMVEKPYKEITITELTNRAELSRRTFYRHFVTMDDVLDYILQAASEQFVLFFCEQQPSDFKSVVFLYFTYWEQHKAFLLLLKKNDLLFLLLQKFLPEVRTKLLDDISNNDNEFILGYMFSFTAGGVWSLLIKWLEDGAKLSPKKMESIAEQISKHIQ